MGFKKFAKYLAFSFLIILISTIIAIPAIQQVAGLAVAQSDIKWNNVKDAAIGDSVTSGILANSLYTFNGTNFDRIRGDMTNGMDVDVTRVSGSVTIAGDNTPADSYTNPTDGLNVYSLSGVYNGSTWDMVRSATKSTNGGNIVTSVDFVQNNVLLSSSARIVNGSTSGLTDYGNYRTALIQVNVTVASGTTPTLDVYIDTSTDDTNWINIAHFTQFITTGRRYIQLSNNTINSVSDIDATTDLAAGSVLTGPWGSTIRVRWVITGTTPSFTFGITGTFKS